MSSQPRLNIQGQAPFKQSGVYEAQIAITDSKPSDDAIRAKQFQFLWRGSFHLRVNNGIFSETIGSESNPLPSSITNLDKIWIVVTDLFSSLHHATGRAFKDFSLTELDAFWDEAKREE